ncbi:uncharacterized protein LOC135812991 [Sycon ciliatum]|uniref:uncharacterized protein LOC135812991 n=1 Tax=Sycon ciliatum TaxID=27933 RepID=UPI0031F70286
MAESDTPVLSPDIAALTQLMRQQMETAATREHHLTQLVERTLRSISQPPPPQRPPPAPPARDHVPAARPVSVDRPMLLASASLAEFAAWEGLWRDYARCQHLDSQDNATRVATVRQCLDEDLRRFLREGTIPLADNHDDDDLIKAVQAYIRGQRNPLLDRIAFYARQQQHGESFDQYLTTLREIHNCCDFSEAALCNFCSSRVCRQCQQGQRTRYDETMRDRLVTGILDTEARHKLLATTDLTLEKVIKLCRAEEAASRTSSSIPGTSSVNAARKTNYQRSKHGNNPRQQQASATPSQCPNCGRTPHASKSQCPAHGKKCSGCKIIGHFQAVCRKSRKPADQSSQRTLGRLQLRRAQCDASPTVPVDTQLCTEPDATSLEWIPDTGSDIDAIGVDQLAHLGGFVENLATDHDNVHAANGERLVSAGKISATLTIGSLKHDSTIHVYRGLREPLLSRQSLYALGLLPDGWPKQVARVCTSSTPPPTAPVVTTGLVNTPDPSKLAQIRADLLREFADVFDDTTLKPMCGKPMDIILEDDAKPHRVYTARPIAHAYREQVKTQLDNMVEEGIIETVSEPCDWCHPIVVVDKKNSSEKRLTVDLQSLNRQVKRPTHPMQNARDVLSGIGTARWFTKFDARHGYWQVPLSESAKSLTTFITPWGRYRFCRNPQGLVSAGDEYNRRTDAAFDRLTHLIKVVDDGLVHDESFSDHVAHVRAVLTRAREHGITLSQKKFVFAAPEVEFCGFHVSSNGYTVPADKTSALQHFNLPTNRTDLRSFLGLVNQCGEFTPRISELAAPLRPLLKTTNEFVWDDVHTAAFNATKSELISPPTLSYYRPGDDLRLETDASALNGLGFVLWQRQDNQWRMLQCGSRFLTDAETRYAVIELELLAVVWAVHKCSLFLSGSRFDLFTDHRSLVPILNKYTLDQIENPRLLRLALKLRSCQLVAHWRKGKENAFADALSRNPVDKPTSEEEFGESSTLSAPAIRACLRQDEDGRIADLRHCELLDAARADDDYQALLQAVREGFPDDQRAVHSAVKPYFTIREHLSVDGDLVLKGQRVVVPRTLRPRVLQDLHASHQGLNRTQRRARQVVYWPHLSNDIAQVVRSCEQCRLHAPSQCKEPMRVTADRRPTLPFQSTSADLFSCQGWEYLVYVDRHTGWPCIAKIGRTASSADVIRVFRGWFADVGVPSILTTDGGPQFSSRRFAEFCTRWQVQHSTSSPHYPQSNGHAEAAVKAMKSLVLKTTSDGNLDVDEFRRALLEWRNTPRENGQSPAQALFGRPLSSFVTAHHLSFAPDWQAKATDVDKRSAAQSATQEQHYDESARSLSPLRIGMRVDIQDPRTKLWRTTGVVVAIGRNRDYMVKLPSGRVYWRNRRLLKPAPAVAPPAPPADTSPAEPAAPQQPCVQQPRRSQRSRQAPERLNISSTASKSYA